MKKLLVFALLLFAGVSVLAQSTNQDFPSPVVSDQISGTIKPRDIGDSRLTRHFYTFYTATGDLFLEIETLNLNGDIDLFEATTLRPLSKISIYASADVAKTSRIVYFRKGERVILRIEGRTPNDEPARYKIGFSGVFRAASDLPRPPEDLEPKVENALSPDAVARVNSVGAIIETLPPKQKPAPPVKRDEEEVETEPKETAEIAKTEEKTVPARRPRTPRRPPAASRAPQPKTEEPLTTAEAKPETPPRNQPKTAPRRTTPAATRRNAPATKKTETSAASEPNPLENIRLLVILKNGNRIERPMSQVLRVNVDKGTLTVITREGKIERYSLLEIEKFSIEQ